MGSLFRGQVSYDLRTIVETHAFFMNIFEQHKQFFNKPILLDTELQESPANVIDEFASDYHLWEAKEYLSKLRDCALLTENSHFSTGIERKHISTFIEDLEILAEAISLLKLKRKK
jgi:hypothetical protein